LLLAAVVLLQAGQGGGLASLGGGTTDLVVGGRQAANLLTKMSWICGGVFLFISLLLSLVSPSRSGASSAVIEQLQNTPAPSAPAPLPLEGTTTPATGGEPQGSQAPAPEPAKPAP
jgi:preprotein translocase subunit SecG